MGSALRPNNTPEMRSRRSRRPVLHRLSACAGTPIAPLPWRPPLRRQASRSSSAVRPEPTAARRRRRRRRRGTETQPSAAEGSGISPGGVTTSVSAAAESTEDEYFQACRAAREWMEQQSGDPEHPDRAVSGHAAVLRRARPQHVRHPVVATVPGAPGRGHRRRPGRRRSGLRVGLPLLITSRRRVILLRSSGLGCAAIHALARATAISRGPKSLSPAGTMPSSPRISSRPPRWRMRAAAGVTPETISRPLWAVELAGPASQRLDRHRRRHVGQGTKAEHDDGVAAALRPRPLLVDARHLGEKPDTRVVQNGHIVARNAVGDRDDPPAAVVGLLHSDQLGGPEALTQ